MLNLNLESLGVTEEALTNAILSELGLSKEEAVTALADKFGVKLNSNSSVKSGETVITENGEAKAEVISEADLSTLRAAAAISTRLFS